MSPFLSGKRRTLVSPFRAVTRAVWLSRCQREVATRTTPTGRVVDQPAVQHQMPESPPDSSHTDPALTRQPGQAWPHPLRQLTVIVVRPLQQDEVHHPLDHRQVVTHIPDKTTGVITSHTPPARSASTSRMSSAGGMVPHLLRRSPRRGQHDARPHPTASGDPVPAVRNAQPSRMPGTRHLTRQCPGSPDRQGGTTTRHRCPQPGRDRRTDRAAHVSLSYHRRGAGSVDLVSRLRGAGSVAGPAFAVPGRSFDVPTAVGARSEQSGNTVPLLLGQGRE